MARRAAHSGVGVAVSPHKSRARYDDLRCSSPAMWAVEWLVEQRLLMSVELCRRESQQGAL